MRENHEKCKQVLKVSIRFWVIFNDSDKIKNISSPFFSLIILYIHQGSMKLCCLLIYNNYSIIFIIQLIFYLRKL